METKTCWKQISGCTSSTFNLSLTTQLLCAQLPVLSEIWILRWFAPLQSQETYIICHSAEINRGLPVQSSDWILSLQTRKESSSVGIFFVTESIYDRTQNCSSPGLLCLKDTFDFSQNPLHIIECCWPLRLSDSSMSSMSLWLQHVRLSQMCIRPCSPGLTDVLL